MFEKLNQAANFPWFVGPLKSVREASLGKHERESLVLAE